MEEVEALPVASAAPRLAGATDADLLRRFDEICARSHTRGGNTGDAGTPVDFFSEPLERSCAVSRALPAASSPQVLGADLGGALSSTAPPKVIAPHGKDRQAWIEGWRQLAGQSRELELDLSHEVLQRWRPSDWSSPVSCRNQLSDLRRSLDESDQSLRRWEQDLWHGVTHLCKRMRAFSQNARRDVGLPEHLEAIARSIDKELECFKRHCSQDFGESFVDDEQLCRELGFLGEHYDACVLRPSAAEPPLPEECAGSAEHRAADSSAEGEDASPPEDPEVSEIRKLLADAEARAWTAAIAVEASPSVHRQVVLRTLRVFKMQLTPAFFAHLDEQLPQVPPQRLSLLVKQIAELESCHAEKRLLLARWRRRQAELVADHACLASELEVAGLALQREHERRLVLQQAERRRCVDLWRRQRALEERTAARRGHRSSPAKKETLREYQVRRDAEAHFATQRLESSMKQRSATRRDDTSLAPPAEERPASSSSRRSARSGVCRSRSSPSLAFAGSRGVAVAS